MPNRRLPAAAAFFAAALTAFAVLLWGLQVTSGAAYYAKSQRSIAQVETVPAARGKLLDRNGTILAQDQVTWSAVLAEDVEDQVVRRLKTLCQEEDVAWEGTGPIAGVTPPSAGPGEGGGAGRGELHPCGPAGGQRHPGPPRSGPGGTDEP